MKHRTNGLSIMSHKELTEFKIAKQPKEQKMKREHEEIS